MADDLKRVGLVFKADGSVDFRKSLQEVNASIQENRSAFELAKSTWDETTKSADKLKDRQKYLAEQTKDYSDKVKLLQEELSALESEENRNEKAIQSKKNQLNTAQKSLYNYQKGLDEVTEKLNSGTAVMEDYAKKIDSISQKLTSAGKTMSKNLTAPIAAVGGLAIKSAMELDEGYDIIIKKTGATGDSLQELNDIADDVFGGMPVDMRDVGTAVGEINTRFGSTGDELKGLTKQFLEFAEINGTDVNESIRLVSRAMGDAGIPTEHTSELLDKLTVAGQASGIEIGKLADNLAKYGAPMRALGLTTDESIAIFAGWEKAGVNTEIAFSGMKKAIGTWGKEGKDATEEFKKTLKAIEQAPDLATATSMAIEIFGQKAGPDLADAIKGGRFEYQDFLNLIQDSAGIVTQTYEATLDPWNQMKVATNELKLAGTDLAGVMFEVLAPIMESLVGKVESFTNWFRNLDDGQKNTIVTIGLLVAAVGPLLVVFGSVAGGASKIIGLTTQIIGIAIKIPGILSTIGTGAKVVWAIMAANPIGAIITVVTLLIAGFVTLYNKCEWFRDGVNAIWSGIKEFLGGVVDWIKDLFDFEWKLPKIKLPHFKIKGSFSLSPPSIPKFSVDWYAKGGILNRPTIFGQNGDSLMGGGEAGPEAVLPIAQLKKYIREENLANNRLLGQIIKEALQEMSIVAENNIYIGDRKFFEILTEMVIGKISSKTKNINLAKGR